MASLPFRKHIMLLTCVAVLTNLISCKPLQPQGRGETLVAVEAATAVLSRVWEPHCCVILLTDGAASPHAVTLGLQQLAAPWGATLLEAGPGAGGPNGTLALLRRALQHARMVRRVSWCVVVVVVSDDPSFLAAWTKLARDGGLLAWPTRLVALTSLQKNHLRHIHLAFSHVNAVLIVSDGGTAPRCEVLVHLPYSEHVIQVARWRPARLTLTSSLPLFPEKFHRFLERPHLRLTAEEFPPHVVVETREEQAGGTKVVFSGSMISLLDFLAESLNFSYSLVRPPDGTFGNKLPNGTATGMVGMVSRQEVDLGLGPFGITAARSTIVDYLAPVFNDYLRILAGRGRPEVDPWGFLLPLAPLVWASLLAALMLLMAIVLLLARCASLAPPALAPYVRVILQENSWLPAMFGWERLVLGSWMLAMLVVTQSYTGNLMSLLAVRYIPQPFQTLRAVLDDTATTMIWEYDTAYVDYFRTTEIGILREVQDVDAAGKIHYVLATEFHDITRRLVRPGSHVFISEDLTAKVLIAHQFSQTGSCDFYTSRETFMSFLYCMIGPKHSPLVPSVSKRINWITEAGLYNHWMTSLSSNSTVCERPPTKITVRTRLSLGNVWGMFAIFVVGNVLSLLLFMLEILAHHSLRPLLTATFSWTKSH